MGVHQPMVPRKPPGGFRVSVRVPLTLRPNARFPVTAGAGTRAQVPGPRPGAAGGPPPALLLGCFCFYVEVRLDVLH